VIVEHVSLVDFRNYATADVALVAGPNLFVGRNGQGKTNLAEAIAYVATLGSHRVSGDQALVRAGAESAILRIRVAHAERSVQLEAQLNRSGRNRARVNGVDVRPAELPRYAQVVVFAPEDLGIVRGDPSARRRFADQLLVQRSPRMAGVLADYDRVLRQRGALLKSARARGIRGEALSTLDVWDEKLVALGSEIIDARQVLATELAAPIEAAYAAIAGEDHRPELEWVLSVRGADPEEGDEAGSGASAGATAELFREALAQKRSAELERGLTLVGPHRDDLRLSIRGLPVKGYASHGESWSVALSLRLASAQLLRADSRSGDPVLILDDVFAELDAQRRVRLSDLTAQFEQVIVTAAVWEDVPQTLRRRIVRIEGGRIVPEPEPEPQHEVEPEPGPAEAEASDAR
jgi:DNA replication and repair protein RecF